MESIAVINDVCNMPSEISAFSSAMLKLSKYTKTEAKKRKTPIAKSTLDNMLKL
jgi:hypothetical protein